MKKIILGYSQEAAVNLGLDLKDLQILRYIYDFIKLGYVFHKEINGETFYWIKSAFLLNEIPILEIKSTEALRRRLRKLVELNVLDYKLVKDGGLFTFYKFGEKYNLLLVKENKTSKKEKDNNEIKKVVEVISKSKQSEEYENREEILKDDGQVAYENNKNEFSNCNENIIEKIEVSEEDNSLEKELELERFIDEDNNQYEEHEEKIPFDNFEFGKKAKKIYPKTTALNLEGDMMFETINPNQKVETNNKQSYINKEKDNKKIYTKKVCEEVIEFLNNELDTKYKSNSKQTIKLIERLIELGFNISDFKKVILNKKRCWKGTEYELYLRPSTLFRESKFEEYLNEKYINKPLKEKVRSLKDIYKPF